MRALFIIKKESRICLFITHGETHQPSENESEQIQSIFLSHIHAFPQVFSKKTADQIGLEDKSRFYLHSFKDVLIVVWLAKEEVEEEENIEEGLELIGERFYRRYRADIESNLADTSVYEEFKPFEGFKDRKFQYRFTCSNRKIRQTDLTSWGIELVFLNRFSKEIKLTDLFLDEIPEKFQILKIDPNSERKFRGSHIDSVTLSIEIGKRLAPKEQFAFAFTVTLDEVPSDVFQLDLKLKFRFMDAGESSEPENLRIPLPLKHFRFKKATLKLQPPLKNIISATLFLDYDKDYLSKMNFELVAIELNERLVVLDNQYSKWFDNDTYHFIQIKEFKEESFRIDFNTESRQSFEDFKNELKNSDPKLIYYLTGIIQDDTKQPPLTQNWLSSQRKVDIRVVGQGEEDLQIIKSLDLYTIFNLYVKTDSGFIKVRTDLIDNRDRLIVKEYYQTRLSGKEVQLKDLLERLKLNYSNNIKDLGIVRDLGKDLYNLLLPKNHRIRNQFESARKEAKNSRKELLLRIFTETEDTRRIPYEIMHDGNSFLIYNPTLNRHTHIIRTDYENLEEDRDLLIPERPTLLLARFYTSAEVIRYWAKLDTSLNALRLIKKETSPGVSNEYTIGRQILKSNISHITVEDTGGGFLYGNQNSFTNRVLEDILEEPNNLKIIWFDFDASETEFDDYSFKTKIPALITYSIPISSYNLDDLRQFTVEFYRIMDKKLDDINIRNLNLIELITDTRKQFINQNNPIFGSIVLRLQFQV